MPITSTGFSKEVKLAPLAKAEATIRPEWAPVDVWQVISGWGKTKPYEHVALGNLRAAKFGKRTLIHIPTGLNYIDNLPDAVLTTGLARRRQD